VSSTLIRSNPGTTAEGQAQGRPGAPRLPLRRVGAWLIDWACILVWVAATFAADVLLHVGDWFRHLTLLELNLMAALVVVIPVVGAASILESRGAAATVGKRLLGLVIHTATGRLPFPTALARNILKIAVPWLIGHAAVFAMWTSHHVSTVQWALALAAYILPIVYIVSLFLGDGRTPYDRITGTRVMRAANPDDLRRALSP
jgi:hypothetical protein